MARCRRKPPEGVCRHCRRAAANGGFASCSACRGRNTERARESYRRRAAQPGRCARCGGDLAAADPRFPRADGCRLCPRCWFSALAKAHLGRRGAGPALAELFLAQGGRCALTGRPLVIGRDASLDHRVPKSRGGGRDLANLRWVAYAANMLKGNLHDVELMAACAEVLAFAAGADKKRIDRALRRAARRLAEG